MRDITGRYDSWRCRLSRFGKKCAIVSLWTLAGLSAVVYVALSNERIVIRNTETIKMVEKSRPLPAVLVRIAECESGNRQYTDAGDVVRGKVNKSDLGRYQINEQIHGDRMRRLGLNIYDAEDNQAYAIMLFEERGTEPWTASRKCWNK
jgi:hypothetical protein